MNEIISKGIAVAEPHGIGSTFYPWQFVSTQAEWIDQMNKLRARSDDMFDEAYPDAYDGGNVGPVGEIIISQHSGYVYVYIIDFRGDWESAVFTTVETAGEYTYIPPFGGYWNTIKL